MAWIYLMVIFNDELIDVGVCPGIMSCFNKTRHCYFDFFAIQNASITVQKIQSLFKDTKDS
jgi:hypothetical protein